MSGTIPPVNPDTPMTVEVSPVTTPAVLPPIVTVSPVPRGYLGTTGSLPDVATISQQVSSAIASIPANKRGCFLVRGDLQKASVALMVRAGDSVAFVARVQKSYHTGGFEADASLRVTFLVGDGAPDPARLSVVDYYRIFRGLGADFTPNGRWRSAVKAVGIRYLSLRPYLDGERWWDSNAS